MTISVTDKVIDCIVLQKPQVQACKRYQLKHQEKNIPHSIKFNLIKNYED